MAVAATLMSVVAHAEAQEPKIPVSIDAPAPTGQRISLDLKGVDILDVLKLLSQKSGLNFVAGRNVSGRVTIFVNDVDVWDAFELIVSANDLAYERRGAIITVMMARDYELLYGQKFDERTRTAMTPLKYAKVVQVSAVLNQIKSAIGRVVADEATNTLILSDTPDRLEHMQDILTQIDRPTQSRVYVLSYTEADKLKEKVQELLSPIGTFTFDARSNTVVITDLREVLEKTDRVIEAFDVPDAQVLIEAKIVKVDLTNAMSLGIDWTQVFSNEFAYRNNFRVLSDIVGTAVAGTTATPGTGTAATGAALRIITGPKNQTQSVIEALNKLTRTETLSSPRIMVSNKQEAKILVGTKEAIVSTTTTVPATGSTVSSPEIQFVDVGTKLYVTPNIKRDGLVQMKIRPEVSTATPSTPVTGVSVPIVSSTEAETNVLVKSGVTIIIGGLMQNKVDRTENRVPFIGELPILGKLFQGSTDTKTKTELVVFLTPEIMMPDGSPYIPPTAGSASPSGEIPTLILEAPVPAAYRAIIRQRFETQLASQLRAASLPQGAVAVSFILSRDGRVVGDPDITSQQGEAFVRAARMALQSAAPFPPFPQEAEAEKIRFRVAIDYNP